MANHNLTPDPHADASGDDAFLGQLGYRPELRRVLGLFSSFAVQFSTHRSDWQHLPALWLRAQQRRARVHLAIHHRRRFPGDSRVVHGRAGVRHAAGRRGLPDRPAAGPSRPRLADGLVAGNRASRRDGRQRGGPGPVLCLGDGYQPCQHRGHRAVLHRPDRIRDDPERGWRQAVRLRQQHRRDIATRRASARSSSSCSSRA